MQTSGSCTAFRRLIARMDFALIFILSSSSQLLLVEKAMSATENVCSPHDFALEDFLPL